MIAILNRGCKMDLNNLYNFKNAVRHFVNIDLLKYPADIENFRTRELCWTMPISFNVQKGNDKYRTLKIPNVLNFVRAYHYYSGLPDFDNIQGINPEHSRMTVNFDTGDFIAGEYDAQLNDDFMNLCLYDNLIKLDIKDFYVSTMGRAKDTASCTLKKMNRTAKECDWLREFDYLIDRPDVTDRRICAWDWLPQDWTVDERFYQYDHWFENDRMREGNVKYYYDMVTGEFDKVLAEHGYVREGHYYRAEKANNDTLVFFCHFGLSCVLLSHLLSVSPMVLWHGACAAPSSVTTLTSEERRKGIASFRMSSYGDISHLYAHNEPPAFAARFCECYDNDERHD